MATDSNYYGGDYRTWSNVRQKPARKNYAPMSVSELIFPEDNLKYLAEPNKPFTFFWHNMKDRFEAEVDDLLDKGYVRVIVEAGPNEEPRPHANFTNPTRWRRGPGGTVISRGRELWAQPADLAIEQAEAEARRLSPKDHVEKTEAEIRGMEEAIRRQGISGVEIVGSVRPKSKK